MSITRTSWVKLFTEIIGIFVIIKLNTIYNAENASFLMSDLAGRIQLRVPPLFKRLT